MKRIVGVLIFSILLTAALALSSHSTPPPRGNQDLLRLSDGKSLSLREALPDIKSAKVILVGELHNEKNHHAFQLEVISSLLQSGLPLAVGMEMFRRDSQETLDKWVSRKMADSEFIKVYYDNWSTPWPLYADILLFAREHGIPVVGLNVSREITGQVARSGFASLSEAQRRELPPVTCAIDEEYKRFIQRSLGMHGHQGIEFNNFCEAQLLWDTAMAWHAVQYLRQNPQRTMVLLAGSGHAWKPGIPRHLESMSPLSYRVILPEIQGRLNRDSATVKDADYLWTD